MDSVSPGQVEHMLRQLAEQALDHAFMLLDPQGRVLWWSRGAERIFGYAPGEIVGKDSRILFAPGDQEAGVPDYEQLVASSDGPAEDDRWMLRRDGSRFWANGIMAALRDDAGKVIAFGKILRNRTDLKEQLETLRNAASEAQAAARRQDIFLGMLSHELRNPLAPIANAVAILRSATGEMSHEVAYAIGAIERQRHMLERLVNDLLEHTRVTSGKVDLRLERVVLQELLAAVTRDLASRAQSRGQSLELLAPAGDIVVNADRDRLHQVFTNLVVNSIKYTPEGGHIWIKASSEGDDALVKVTDDGIGIPTEMQPRIFELFTQVESARGSSQGGLGLGLAIVKDLVALHGGSVQVRSEGPGKGSEFSVRMPLVAQGPA
jgi:two-component system CheB/CheR fusion protein